MLQNNSYIQKIGLERFKSYYEFLVNNGVNKKILNIPYIKELIINLILNGDPRVILEGKSPIVYLPPHEDGTFDIGAKLDGPQISNLYRISYCNDGVSDHYIKITTSNTYTVQYSIDGPSPLGYPYDVVETTIIYINHDGKKGETTKTVTAIEENLSHKTI